jgi:hypothetical protein
MRAPYSINNRRPLPSIGGMDTDEHTIQVFTGRGMTSNKYSGSRLINSRANIANRLYVQSRRLFGSTNINTFARIHS